MRNTKHQDPKTRETPRSKNQGSAVVYSLSGTEKTDDESLSWILSDGDDANARKLHPFDLEERTARFGERVVRFVKKIPRGVNHPENNRLVDQLIGCGTSVGANYCEANDCVSQKDFKFTIKRCIKEAKEARELYCEATELIRIFASMHSK